MKEQGASAVVTHQVLKGKEQEYENWLQQVVPLSKQAKGHLDWQIIRPIPNVTFTYTMIVRFDTAENLEAWMHSQKRKDLLKAALPLLDKGDDYYIKKGWDFLFRPSSFTLRAPRWKQYLMAWSAIYPISIFTHHVIRPVMEMMGIPKNPYIDPIWSTGVAIFLMVYVVMPRYTHWLRGWLYEEAGLAS